MQIASRDVRVRNRPGTMTPKARATSRRRGAAMIEFALVLPIFIALMMCGPLLSITQSARCESAASEISAREG